MKRKIILPILLFLSLFMLLLGIFLFFNKIENENPITHTLLLNDQEIYVKNNSLIIHGILRNIEEVDGLITLKIEVWNHNNNKYSVESISFPNTLLFHGQDILSLKLANSFPIVDISINFNWAAHNDSKKIENFLTGGKEKFVNVKNVEIINKVQQITNLIDNNPTYISDTLKRLLLQSYDMDNSSIESEQQTSLSDYLTLNPQSKRKINPVNLAFLRKSVGLEPNYVLPENYWKNVISKTEWDWSKYTSLEDYLNTKFLDIDASRYVWNDSDIHYKGTNRLGYIRRLSEYLWFTSSYYIANSFNCNEEQNTQICNELVDLYTYNKSFLIDYNLRGGYGVCSATYMLPELIQLTNNDALKDDLELIKQNKEKIYKSCTFSGGGSGLCSRDLKESVNCGMLLSSTNDIDLVKNFVLDRYAFFDELIYQDKITYPLSSKNAIYSEFDILGGDKPMYISRYMEYVKFLNVVDTIHL